MYPDWTSPSYGLSSLKESIDWFQVQKETCQLAFGEKSDVKKDQCSHSLLGSLLSDSPETHDGSLGSGSRSCLELVSTTSDLLTSLFALPDATSSSLHRVLTAEGRHVSGVL